MLPSPLTPFPILLWTFMSSKTPGRDLKDMGSLDRMTPFPTLSETPMSSKTPWKDLESQGFKMFDLSGKIPVSELQSCSCYLGLAIWSHYLDLAIPVLLSLSHYLSLIILISLSRFRYLNLAILVLLSWRFLTKLEMMSGGWGLGQPLWSFPESFMKIKHLEPFQDSPCPSSLFLESWRTWRFLTKLELVSGG